MTVHDTKLLHSSDVVLTIGLTFIFRTLSPTFSVHNTALFLLRVKLMQSEHQGA